VLGDKFRVVEQLGEGVFGRVYLVDALSTGSVYALKTIRDDLLPDPKARETFRRDAQIWVTLERHPWLAHAFHAGEIEGRLFLAMEYVAPDEEGLNSLEGRLRRSPPDLAQSLRWGVQFCHAMEHAFARGLRSHGNIKPTNILIGQDLSVRISDFGTAGLRMATGTPTHMAPEQFGNAQRADQRSDVYAFGVVLFEMAAKGQLPFPAPALPEDPKRAHPPRLDSPLRPIVARCLEKSPERRYPGFADLRGDLEALLLHETEEVLRPPRRTESEAWELSNKGRGLMALGRPEPALACLERALVMNPLAAAIHHNKGNILSALGRLEDALRSFERAAELDPQYAGPWASKGRALAATGRDQEALECFERALARNPRSADTWNQRGTVLARMGREEAARSAFEKAETLVGGPSSGPKIAPSAVPPAASLPAAPTAASSSAPPTVLVPQAAPASPPPPPPARPQRAFIGPRYEVYEVLGEVGFGTVYLAYDHATKGVYALKTLRDEYLADRKVRETFEREARAWVKLERHPYLVRARFVEEVAGRLYLAMDYVAPEEPGLRSLEEHLERRPPSLVQSLRWGIQFCHAMAHANAGGILCHRDIKPANILIGADRAVRVSDFGLAGGRPGPDCEPGSVLPADRTRVDTVFGTPTHMAPEQFKGADACDERSDVYAFGVVLFQMASGGRLPFLAQVEERNPQRRARRFWQEMSRLHAEAEVKALDSQAFPVIRRCLEKDPARRYPDFAELARELGALLKGEANEEVTPPTGKTLAAGEWVDQGLSLAALERFEEALASFDRAIALESRHAPAWSHKGNVLHRLGRSEEALVCYTEALGRNPQYGPAWREKGVCLTRLGRPEEALPCFDQALALEPDSPAAWNGKALWLKNARHLREALGCLQEAVVLDPGREATWINRAECLEGLGDFEGALVASDKALELQPMSGVAWRSKGTALLGLGKAEAALPCFEKATELAPTSAAAWSDKGRALQALGRFADALVAQETALSREPALRTAWNERGNALMSLGRAAEALSCFDKAMELGLDEAGVRHRRGLSLRALGRLDEAAAAFREAVARDPSLNPAWYFLGAVLRAQERDLEALACFDRVLEQERDDRRAVFLSWRHKGECLARLGRREEAARALDEALAREPRDTQARAAREALEAAPPAAAPPAPTAAATAADLLARGDLALQAGRPEEALALFDQALLAEPEDPTLLSRRASCLNALERWPDALGAADRALTKDPRQARAWVDKGQALNGLERHLEALQCLEDAVALDPSLDFAWYLKGNAFSAVGQEQEALDCYTRCLELNPERANAWYNKAAGLYRLKRHKEAIECADRVLALAPRSDHALFCKGNALDDLGRFEDAVVAFDQALAIDPRQIWAWHNRGMCLKKLGQLEQAVSSFDAALAVGPEYPIVLFNRANALDQAGRLPEAVRAWQAFLETAPAGGSSRRERAEERLRALTPALRESAQGDLAGGSEATAVARQAVFLTAPECEERGAVSLGERQHVKALAWFEEAVQKDPARAVSWCGKGESFFALGRLEEALLAFDRALLADPGFALARFHKACTEDRLGRSAEAARSFHDFLGAAPPHMENQAQHARARLSVLRSG
jgi:tetratricopeptide (TPR) repeat protein